MKKKNIIKPKYVISKWIYVLFFSVLTLCSLFAIKKLDNDIWYLLSEGRYIVQNGIYHIDPLSMHEGFHIVVQNWLSASILWLLFSGFGEMGIVTFVLICNFFIAYFCYKICMVISDDNPILSLAIAFATDALLIPNFVVTRPQVFSFALLLGLIYVLELYIKKDNGKYLIWLPIISFIEANMHASLWWMIYLFTLPYIIDGLRIKFLRTQGYRLKPLLIAIGVALVVGLINPYGYKMATFIFTSYGDKYMHMFISELLPFQFSSRLGKSSFILMLFVPLCMIFFREGKIRIRYICLFCGTLILGFMSIKGLAHFTLVSLFPLAYFFKDLFPLRIYEDIKPTENIIKWMFCAFSILTIGFGSYYYFTDIKRVKLHHDAEDVLNAMEKSFDKEKDTVYVSFNDGGYVEYRGFKSYIDPRAEVFLKINNKKADIFKENYELANGKLNLHEFLEKYKFSLLLVNNKDYIYNHITDEENYFIIYDNTKTTYRLYARNDLFTEEERKDIINRYSDAVNKAKEKSQNK